MRLLPRIPTEQRLQADVVAKLLSIKLDEIARFIRFVARSLKRIAKRNYIQNTTT